MPEILKKRSTAAVISAVLMALFLVIGVGKSLRAAANDVSDAFYDGVYDEEEKYTRPSISNLLEERIDASLGLISVASGYDGLEALTDALRTSRNALINAGSVHEKYEADMAMAADFDRLYSALSEKELTEKDSSAARDYGLTMSSTAALIDESGYNEAVSDFNSGTLEKFPTVLLWPLSGAEKPELFK